MKPEGGREGGRERGEGWLLAPCSPEPMLDAPSAALDPELQEDGK